MKLVIRRIHGDDPPVEQRFEGDEITLGRAPGNTIALGGLLVALRHARLKSHAGSDRILYLESLCTVGVELNDAPGVQSGEVQIGDVMRIGGHGLRLSITDDGAELVLEVETTDPRQALSRAAARTSLADAGLGMRRPAIALALLVLVGGLLVPMVLGRVPMPPAVAAMMPTDEFWLSGRVSNAHVQFGYACTTCHATPFVRVQDAACFSCHEGIRQHSDEPAILAAHDLGERRCASCHREHEGPHGMLPRAATVCTDCHGDPGQFPEFPDLRAVGDFGDDHPEFRATVGTLRDGVRGTARAAAGSDIRDQPGLIFPHDVHLKDQGVRGPEGPELLPCANCHEPAVGQVGFEPVRYEPHCQRCHELEIDVGGRARRLPHGDNELARSNLALWARQPAVAEAPSEEPERRRAGDEARRGGPVTAAELIDEVFERRLCVKCHDVAKAGGQAAVIPPALRQSWYVQAYFTHEAHSWEACGACHAAKASASADDLLLPGIESCRQCHGGVDSSRGIQSACIDCHRFHEASSLTFGEFTGGPADAAVRAQDVRED